MQKNQHPILIYLHQKIWENLEEISQKRKEIKTPQKGRRTREQIEEDEKQENPKLPHTITGLIREAIMSYYEFSDPDPDPDIEYAPLPSKSLEERFWEKVDKEEKEKDDCWLWNSNKSKDNYGVFSYKNTKTLAHKISYMIHHNLTEPPKEAVHRTCENKDCVNPQHLYTKSDLRETPRIKDFKEISKLSEITEEEEEEEEEIESENEREERKKLEREKAKAKADRLLKMLE